MSEQQPVAVPRKLWRSLKQNAVRMFRGAETDRLTSGWGSIPLPADTIIERNQRVLVARSREQAINNDHAKAFIRMCRQNIVGPQGVLMQAQAADDKGKLDAAANEAIETAWKDWTKRTNCDVRAMRSWREIQNACITSAAKDGEFFVRFVYGADAGPWGFALQTLDAQRCPIDMHDKKLRSGNFIRQGIEWNRYGRPIAYYFESADLTESDYQYGGRDYIRIPADEILHGFEGIMEGQKRGLPWFATSLFRLRQLNEFEDSALVNARVSANKMGFIQWKDDATGPEFDPEIDEILIESKAGEFPVLPPGAELKEWNPNYPSGEFMPFHKAMLRSIASGMGVPYNELASDLEGVNFSSIRQGTLDAREHWKGQQEWLIESLIDPVFNVWLEVSLLRGKIKSRNKPLRPDRIDRYSKVSFQPRRWQWIDPRADVDAAVASKNNMLTSPGRIIREQGLDPQDVWRESARDVAAMIEALKTEGIDDATAKELVLLSMGKQPEGQRGRPPEKASSKV